MKNLFSPKPYGATITIPNFITAIGIFLIIPYVWGFIVSGNRWVMFGSLFLAECSDLFDGLCARGFDQRTRLGEILDPLRDRLICVAVLGNIILLGGRPLLVPICLVVVIELMIYLIGLYRHYFGNYYIGPGVHLAGKIRQASHLVIAGLVIIGHYFNDIVVALVGFDFSFSLEAGVITMALFSCIALLFYSQAGDQ